MVQKARLLWSGGRGSRKDDAGHSLLGTQGHVGTAQFSGQPVSQGLGIAGNRHVQVTTRPAQERISQVAAYQKNGAILCGEEFY